MSMQYNPLRRFGRDDNGAVAVLITLMVVLLVGFLAIGVETAMWWQTQQKMQNASDAASVTAALNYKSNSNKTKAQAEAGALITDSSRYDMPSSKYTVTYTWTSASGASCASDCKYVKVDITSQPSPLFSGAMGNFMSGSNHISSSATASITSSGDACILALARSNSSCPFGSAGTYTGEGLRFNGSPNVNLSGCGLMSNAQGSSSTNCNGHELNADFVASVNTVDSACESDESKRWTNRAVEPDPYESRKTSIPSNYRDATACGGSFAVTTISSATASRVFCGGLKINASMTLSAGTYYIINGDLAFKKGITVQGTDVTFVLTGTNTGASHTIVDDNGSGGVHFQVMAPDESTNAFQGIVIYQDPDLCYNTNMTSSGNGLQIETQGVWYMPTSDVTLSGAISKNANVANQCMLMVVNTLRVNGGVTMSAAGCSTYGVTPPAITN